VDGLLLLKFINVKMIASVIDWILVLTT